MILILTNKEDVHPTPVIEYLQTMISVGGQMLMARTSISGTSVPAWNSGDMM